jgi:hypothetical protein
VLAVVFVAFMAGHLFDLLLMVGIVIVLGALLGIDSRKTYF